MTAFFVVLRMGDGKPAVMEDEDERIALFATEIEADEAAGNNPLGKAFGWETYPWMV